jgi:hypothetical protein
MFEKHEGTLPEEVSREIRFVKRITRVGNLFSDLLDSVDLGLENHIRIHFQSSSENFRKEISDLLGSVERKITNGINRVYSCSKDDFFVLHLVTSFRGLVFSLSRALSLSFLSVFPSLSSSLHLLFSLYFGIPAIITQTSSSSQSIR